MQSIRKGLIKLNKVRMAVYTVVIFFLRLKRRKDNKDRFTY